MCECVILIATGIGYGMVIISAIVCIYYNMIIAWTLHYFFNSFLAVLPWSTCNNEWNTERCLDSSRRLALNMTNTTTTSPLVNSSLTWTTPSEEYWEYVLLFITFLEEGKGDMRCEPSRFSILARLRKVIMPVYLAKIV